MTISSIMSAVMPALSIAALPTVMADPWPELLQASHKFGYCGPACAYYYDFLQLLPPSDN
jgi:hypothetical protein